MTTLLDVPVPTRAQLRAHLEATRIAGDVATPRENNLRNFRLMSERNPQFLFGLEPAGSWTPEEVLALMARRCGVVPDPGYRAGPDRIDVALTLAALDRYAARLARAAQRRERVMVATGHPAGLFAIHVEVARALEEAGCRLLMPAAGWAYQTQTREGPAWRDLRYIGGVAVLHAGAELKHTHSARPMRAMLQALADAGEGPPDLVVADHGWAGAAGQAGVDAIGFADCNDPALFVGEAEGKVKVVVPLDDNVAPHHYAPLTAYLLDAAGLLHDSSQPLPQ